MSILLKNVIRPEIFELSAYHVPPAKGMIKLDAMENPYPLSLTLREEIAQLAEMQPSIDTQTQQRAY